ncbi:tripartite tricarboxylate transporter substrate-binding protein [Variovorax boronicumulans]|uniref:tripartite tricarboxylate transporter substrate-binding protein n=1 Tax=Variovorax boronicumulans TaxID=436515 RepID=UPI0027D8DD33|nr:tripartite tricarboxylate transporter substrate-binding protein [Variovorax boronicumulans]
MFDGLPAAAGSIRAGRLKLLPMTGNKRHASFPGVPTFAEAGLPDSAPIAWQGILAPAGTPKPIFEKPSAAMRKACQSEELAKKWREYGGPLRCDPAEFAAFLHADRQMWGRVISRTSRWTDAPSLTGSADHVGLGGHHADANRGAGRGASGIPIEFYREHLRGQMAKLMERQLQNFRFAH